LVKVAKRGLGSLPSSFAANSGTFGPDKRTMPTPPVPGGVAMAQMVSVSAFRSVRFCA
jgi:hypothetical protein